MKIIFMGTPKFSIPSLRVLLQSRHDIVGVVTVPDKPAGRRLKIIASDIKNYAQDQGLEIAQPTDLKDQKFIDWLYEKNADLFVVVAFRILPPEVFEIPPSGTINLHASLLPKYRGAAPINWAIINGEKETGVTTFFIEKTVDTGNIILQRSTSIRDDETAGELHDRLAIIGSETVLQTVNAIAENKAPRIPQTGQVTPAPKIKREMCEIKWNADSGQIHNLVRGLSPYPCAFTTFRSQSLKIFRTEVITDNGMRKSPGQIIYIDKNTFHVQTGKGTIAVLELQIEGKKKMATQEFLRGYSLPLNDIFGKQE